jgi:hypothetical protein
MQLPAAISAGCLLLTGGPAHHRHCAWPPLSTDQFPPLAWSENQHGPGAA